jgi:hypothetical protein
MGTKAFDKHYGVSHGFTQLILLGDALHLIDGGRDAHAEQGRAWAAQTRAMLGR